MREGQPLPYNLGASLLHKFDNAYVELQQKSVGHVARWTAIHLDWSCVLAYINNNIAQLLAKWLNFGIKVGNLGAKNIFLDGKVAFFKK